MGFSLALGLALFGCQSEQPPPPSVVLVGGHRVGARMGAADLGLGDGGFRGPARTAAGDPDAWVTPGGALVQVRQAGTKIHFPGGAELLFTPSGYFHLRDGSQAGPFRYGFELVLADGSAIRISRSPSSRHKTGEVIAVVGRELTRLWRRSQPDRRPIRWREFRGQRLMALGDGSAVFSACANGPMLFLDRELASKKAIAAIPAQRIYVHGDVLRESLQRLPARYPSADGQFPDVHKVARRLGGSASGLFPAGTFSLPVFRRDPLIVGLNGGYQLRIDARQSGPIVVGLAEPEAALPTLEWVMSRRQKLELLRPGATDKPGRRYFGQGLHLLRSDRWPIEARREIQDAIFAKGVVEAVAKRNASTPRDGAGRDQ